MSIDLDIRLPSSASSNVVKLTKNMGRKRSEPAQKCLERIRILLSQQAAPGKGKTRGQASDRDAMMASCPPISFTPKSRTGAEEVTTSMTNDVFWSRIENVIIGETIIRVLFNCPTVTHLAPPQYLAAGMPAICSDVRVLFSPSPTTDGLQHEWRLLDAHAKEDEEQEHDDGSNVLSRHRVFIPSHDLVGKRLVYRCKPISAHTPRGSTTREEGASNDDSMSASSTDALWTEVQLPVVQVALPKQGRWQRWLDEPRDGSNQSTSAFRVMSYNILHDDFCTSTFAKKKLYPFATDDILNVHYRKSLIVAEVADVRPEIFCFQECGKTLTETFFRDAFDNLGYEAVYSNKNGLVREGCLTGFLRSRYELIGHVREPLVMSTLSSRHPEVAAVIQREHPHLEEALHRVTSVGSVTVLRDKQNGRVVIVGNTHLFYHPNGCHIRALQALMFLHLVNDTRHSGLTGCLTEEDRKCAAVVLAGDFNFTRITGGYKLMTTGEVDDANTCWEKGYKFWWGCDKGQGGVASEEEQSNGDGKPPAASTAATATEEANGIVVPPPGPPTSALQMHLRSPIAPLEDTHVNDPTIRWTNYALSFKAIIDHIFVDRSTLRTVSTIPFPTEEEISKDVAIPSALFPSDHVPLVAELDYVEIDERSKGSMEKTLDVDKIGS